VKEIALTQGKAAIVDDEDFEFVSQFKWHACGRGGSRWYARRKVGVLGQPVFLKLHNALVTPGPAEVVDHINHDGLDNRRSNLRICTRQENGWNKLRPANNTSGFKGVSWHADRQLWRAVVHISRRQKYIGSFDTAEQAARAYDTAAVALFGAFAHLNFPEAAL
jgi:hypothetical protein